MALTRATDAQRRAEFLATVNAAVLGLTQAKGKMCYPDRVADDAIIIAEKIHGFKLSDVNE